MKKHFFFYCLTSGMLAINFSCNSGNENSVAEIVTEAASTPTCQAVAFPRLTYDKSHIFPADQSLAQPEDGKMLPDGRIVVAHEAEGLHIIEPDGSHRAFGKFKAAGYIHNPPAAPGGAKGVFLEKDGWHILVADTGAGKIFRVDATTEETIAIYDHPYGINNLYRDSQGTIWFTQSTDNSDGEIGKLWGALNRPIPTGAVYILAGAGNKVNASAELVADSLYFPNGITLDKEEQYLYVAELMMDRILRFKVDVQTGEVFSREHYQTVPGPDNIATDPDNNLWVALPGLNSVMAIDRNCRSLHAVFSAASDHNAIQYEKWIQRSHLGLPLLELMTPDMFAPLSGFLTGMFWSTDGHTVYFTGLGTGMLKYSLN